MGQVTLDGAIDLHCHYGPESVVGVPHSVDAFEAAEDAAALGFAALVLKSHDFPSNSVAYAVSKTVPGVRVFGSVCCDFCIGGLNPGAVETALHDGAAIVWLPTISSQQDVENGVAALLGVPGPGIKLFDDNGGLADVVLQIMDLVVEHDAILATGHTSAAEHFAVACSYARRGRLVVTHAMNAGAGPHLTVAQCLELADLGAFIELAAASCMTGHGPGVDEVIRAVDTIGYQHIVLATDYGWNAELPRPAAGLHSYVDALYSAGAPEAQLREMACATPARLLGLA